MQNHALNTDIQKPAYGTTKNIVFNDAVKTQVFYNPTGATTFTADVSGGGITQGDTLEMIFKGDGSADRTMTFSTGYSGLSSSTLVVDADNSSAICFTFDGLNWIEKSRTAGA